MTTAASPSVARRLRARPISHPTERPQIPGERPGLVGRGDDLDQQVLLFRRGGGDLLHVGDKLEEVRACRSVGIRVGRVRVSGEIGPVGLDGQIDESRDECGQDEDLDELEAADPQEEPDAVPGEDDEAEIEGQDVPRRLVRDEAVDGGRDDGEEKDKTDKAGAAVLPRVVSERGDASGRGEKEKEGLAPDRAAGGSWHRPASENNNTRGGRGSRDVRPG